MQSKYALARASAGLVAAYLVAGALTAPAAAAAAKGLPQGVAAAALEREPALSVPHGWPFPQQFSQTSGTGRMIGGAFEWTDWVYDDYGAASPEALPLNSITESADALAPAQGEDVYPSGAADDDGADIFRAAVGETSNATIWRVDWNTLADPSVPIAEWTFDTDDNAATGASQWRGDAEVSSPGIEEALIVSAKGAELVNAVTNQTIASFPTAVDMSARSFLVTIPRSVMPVSGQWRIRLGAGLADPAGTGFAVPTQSGGSPASPTAPRVYNTTFRSAAQEPAIYTGGPSDRLAAELHAALKNQTLLGAYGFQGIPGALTANWWSEDDQAETLATGNVSKFSQLVDWNALAHRARTNPPLVKGWSDRWYVTDLDLGQGVDDTTEANPAFLSRVQPYAVYVPGNYTPKRQLPLTWLLHSADANYNQYGAINPRLVQEACQERDSICVSTEGFGGDGLYQGDAEHDFWQVWRQAALAYRLAPNRTVIGGYSMGGLGSFVLPATYPSDFSEAMPLDGGFDDACSSASGEGTTQFDIAAAADRTANVHWVPFVISNSYSDELSPYPVELINLGRYEAAEDQVTLFSTSAPEHVTTDLTDGFASQVEALHGTPVAVIDPGTIDYIWCANTVDPKLRLGPTSVYWLSHLSERNASPASTTARIVARDGAIPEPVETEQVSAAAIHPADAPPMLVTTGSGVLGAAPASVRALSLALTNVAALTIDARASKLARGSATVTTDGRTRIVLIRLKRGTRVHGPKRTVRVNRSGSATILLGAGRWRLSWSVPIRRR
jgi:hypothetical protein